MRRRNPAAYGRYRIPFLLVKSVVGLVGSRLVGEKELLLRSRRSGLKLIASRGPLLGVEAYSIDTKPFWLLLEFGLQ